MTKQLRIVSVTLHYGAFTETDQEAIDFVHDAIEDWQFPDDRAVVQVVTNLDSRQLPLPKTDTVYHAQMDAGNQLTIEEAYKQSPKPALLAPASIQYPLDL